jgi:predicted transcriptional regulator of viral defense system
VPTQTRLSIAKADIVRHFDAAPQKVYMQSEIAKTLGQNRAFWRLAQRTTTAQFLEYLLHSGRLREHTLRSEEYHKVVTRYSWGEASVYELAVSLAKTAYLSHGTAVFLHGLTDLIPKTLYLNIEQSVKPAPAGRLTQESLDRAFANKQRRSNLSYSYDGWTVTVISGKNTARLGVDPIEGPGSEKIAATNLERTLIDIVVRPAYAGGILQVLQAYRAAKDRLSTNRLVAYLKRLDYVYPYQQAIGFLMERAGYEESRYSLLQEMKSPFKFYLTHGLDKPSFNSRWQLFFPHGLER